MRMRSFRRAVAIRHTIGLRQENSSIMNVALLPLSAVAGCMLLGLGCAYAGLQAGFPSKCDGPALGDLSLMAPITFPAGAAISMFYIFLFLQSASAFTAHAKLKAEARSRGEKAPLLSDVKYSRNGLGVASVLAMDRTVGNFLEQALPFFLGLFLYALFVGCNTAAKLGWVWVASRAYYPLVFRHPFPAVLASTLPAYLCVLYLWFGVIVAASGRLQ